jgi:hypothetical protein
MSGRGGRREGAGRPAGSGWRPAVANLRLEAIEQMQAIVGSESDPLAVVVAMACDEKLDRQTRLGAAAIALPYLYPRLSATTVQANHIVTKIDATELLARIADRIGRLVPRTVDVAATEQAAEVAA